MNTPELHSPSDDLLRDWLIGQDADALGAIERWTDGHPARRAWLEQLRATYDAGRLAEPRIDARAAFERVRARMHENGDGLHLQVDGADGATHRTPTIDVMPHTHARGIFAARSLSWSHTSGRYSYAVFALAIMALGVVASKWNGLRRLWSPGQEVATEYRTGVAQRLAFRLPDGSQVTLAPNSHLIVAPDFDQSTREMTLEGQAYFDVAPGYRAPFIVHSSRLTARVLGTAFNMRAYAGDVTTEIAVINGRIAVQRDNAERERPNVILDAGMVGRMNDSMTVITEQKDMSSYSDWRSGKLAFHNAPLPDVLEVLGRWYGLDFRIADSALTKWHVTVTINGQSLPGMMAFLKTIVGVSMTFEGKDGHIVKLYQAPLAPKGTPLRMPRNLQLFQPKEVGR